MPMIGIIVDDIESTPFMHTMFRELNKLSETRDYYLFANQVKTLPTHNKFCILQQIEALQHQGTLISTSLINTQILANCLTCTNKYYYVYDLDWMKMNNFNSKQLINIFLNEEINLLARSDSHYQVLSKNFQSPVGIVSNWDHRAIAEYIE
jgi:hypothetical protein